MYRMQAFVKIKFNNIVMWLLMRKMKNVKFSQKLYLINISRINNPKNLTNQPQ